MPNEQEHGAQPAQKGKAAIRWLGMPGMVLLASVCPVAMFFWQGEIRRTVENYGAMEGGLMDAQIRAYNFHLWFEEAMAGDARVQMGEVWDDLTHAAALVDALIQGGRTEHDAIVRPLEDAGYRGQAADMRALLDQVREIGRQRQEDPVGGAVGSDLDVRMDAAFKEFACLARSLEMALERERIQCQIRANRLFRASLGAWIAIVLGAMLGLGMLERRRHRAEQSLQRANERLNAQADELMSHREHLSELVEERSAQWRQANEALEREVGERRAIEAELRRSGRQLRYLSSQILRAQESERRRISRELHDELGQALATLKLRLGLMKEALPEGPEGARKECAELVRYCDQVIEEVRRLSRDLSPAVLEYFGLSAAIRRLAADFAEHQGLEITLDLMDCDGFLPKDAQIMVYRIFQEALNNVGKHAQAARVRASMAKDDGRIAFTVEDDGNGFDADGIPTGNGTGKGLGLIIMRERAMMLGATLHVRSEPGKGTRVSLSVPAQSMGG
jgi:signal transduction histidine kinase